MLSSPFNKDISHIIESDFSEEIALSFPPSEDSVSIHGIFEENYIEIQPGGDLDVASNPPRLILSKKAVMENSINRNSAFDIRGVRYTVTEHIENDSSGVQIFYLEGGSSAGF